MTLRERRLSFFSETCFYRVKFECVMIAEAIFHWAKQCPDKPAIVHGGRAVSYGEFRLLISLARDFFVRRNCVGDGYAIIATGNLLEFWISSLALRSLGLTTVQVPGPTALDEIVVEGRRVVVSFAGSTWPSLASRCEQRGLELVQVVLAGGEALDLDQGPSTSGAGGHLLRTSGTTGDYKLVLMTAKADAVFLRRKTEVIGMNHETVLCAFDFPAWTAAGYRWAASPWTVGGTVVLEQRRDIHLALGQPGLTHAVMVPSTLASVLSAAEGSFPYNDQLRLTVGGGAMTDKQVEQVKARITPRLFNLLASTEGGVIAHTPIRDIGDMRSHSLVADRLVEIVDEHDAPAPQGTTGRVRVGVRGLVDAYINNAPATIECFRDGFFYPGDMAFIKPDGRLVLQGRVSDLLNVGGFKVSPLSLEEPLMNYLGVAVCVLSMFSDCGEEELHVVLESNHAFDQAKIASMLRGTGKFFSRVKVHFLRPLARNEMGKILRHEVRRQILSSEGRDKTV